VTGRKRPTTVVRIQVLGLRIIHAVLKPLLFLKKEKAPTKVFANALNGLNGITGAKQRIIAVLGCAMEVALSQNLHFLPLHSRIQWSKPLKTETLFNWRLIPANE
jgi:hypothetical protein